MVRALGLAVLSALLGSCVGGVCTEIGCSNSASITVKTASGEWAGGEYALLVALDGVEHDCSFTMPDDLPSGVGQSGQFECTPSLSANFAPRVMCTEHSDGNSSSQSCTPIPNQFDLQIFVDGTPASVSVKLARDGAVLVNETHALAYEQFSPNGPDCGPSCTQASLAIQVP